MIWFERSLLDQEDIDYLFNLYRNSINWVNIDGSWYERHLPPLSGRFLASLFNVDEFQPVWSKIKDRIAAKLGCDVELVYCRILKYNLECYSPNHRDTFDPGQRENDISVILQLAHPGKYRGGRMLAGGEDTRLQQGDAVFFTYDVDHEVEPIKRGIRYVVNLRCNRIKV